MGSYKNVHVHQRFLGSNLVFYKQSLKDKFDSLDFANPTLTLVVLLSEHTTGRWLMYMIDIFIVNIYSFYNSTLQLILNGLIIHFQTSTFFSGWYCKAFTYENAMVHPEDHVTMATQPHIMYQQNVVYPEIFLQFLPEGIPSILLTNSTAKNS